MAGLIRVLLADDHPVVAQGTAALLNADSSIEVVGTALTVADAIALARSACPDVVISDIMFGSSPSGFEVVSGLRGTPVILMSTFDQPAYYRTALERGAAGYVLKSAPVERLLAAINAVAAGGTFFTREAMDAARQAARSPSNREAQVLALVASGRSNGEIAGALGIEENTVETHLRRMYARYDCANRAELATRALIEGWIGTA